MKKRVKFISNTLLLFSAVLLALMPVLHAVHLELCHASHDASCDHQHRSCSHHSGRLHQNIVCAVVDASGNVHDGYYSKQGAHASECPLCGCFAAHSKNLFCSQQQDCFCADLTGSFTGSSVSAPLIGFYPKNIYSRAPPLC